jgi:4-amino-4-deoxy-L-arabinose transferase-like glycosyltransferase
MAKLFTRERVGTPQFVAGILLVIFLAQCVWLIAHIPAGAVSTEEFAGVQQGIAQWKEKGIAGTPTALGGNAVAIPNSGRGYDGDHSPLWYLIESAPLALFRVGLTSSAGNWLSRLPYVLIGALLGASLWYVSRRLCGNTGGYIALSLYCFSPAVIRSSTLWFSEPNMVGAWGTFGAIFTAIAVSHTLYAPREVVLWNWRRILLLGISLALAVGTRFSLVIILPVLLILMLYVAAERWAAALAIFASACVVGFVLLFASYFFKASLFRQSLEHAKWLDFSWQALGMGGAWLLVLKEVVASGPVLVLLVPTALAIYVSWRRTRYFGNTVPLAIAIIFILLRVASPHESDSVYTLIAVVFLFLLVAGIAADLLETRFRELTAAVMIGLLAANALWNLAGLARLW